MSEFVGVTIDSTTHVIESLRASVAGAKFDICHIHKLPGYRDRGFLKRFSDLHCEPIDDETRHKLKLYLVNFFLCPEAEDELEVLGYMEIVWPSKGESRESEQRTVFKIGKYRVVKDA